MSGVHCLEHPQCDYIQYGISLYILGRHKGLLHHNHPLEAIQTFMFSFCVVRPFIKYTEDGQLHVAGQVFYSTLLNGNGGALILIGNHASRYKALTSRAVYHN